MLLCLILSAVQGMVGNITQASRSVGRSPIIIVHITTCTSEYTLPTRRYKSTHGKTQCFCITSNFISLNGPSFQIILLTCRLFAWQLCKMCSPNTQVTICTHKKWAKVLRCVSLLNNQAMECVCSPTD